MSFDDLGEGLMTACLMGEFPTVRNIVSLLETTIVNYRYSETGSTPAIHCCVWSGEKSEILQFLLDQGANADLANIYGTTPLIATAVYNNYESAIVLVRHGVVLDAVNNNGRTALWHASYFGYLSLLQLLVQSGADIGRADNRGLAPIAMARVQNHTAVVAYLTIELNWKRRRDYATMLNSLKGAPTNSKILRVFQCYDLARVIGTYL
jgi:ankyrin repeat protein